MVKFRARALEWLQSKTYMKSEIDTALNGKSDSNHAHSQYLTSHRTVDSSFNNSSTNAVQNRVVAGAFEELEDNLQYEILCFTDQSLTTSAYNFDIDSDVYIVVNAYDVYGNRVSFTGAEEELTVVTSNGSVTVAPAQAITRGGYFSCLYVYTADSWGQCRFSIKTFSTQINVTGWKEVETLANNRIKVYRNDKFINVSVKGTWNLTSATSNVLGTISSEYHPSTPLVSIGINTSNANRVYIWTNGNVTLYSLSSQTGNNEVQCSFTYPMQT